MAEDGSRKPLSQTSREASYPIKKGEQFRPAAPQLPFVLEKICRRKVTDIASYDGLRKTIVKKAQRVVNEQVVYMTLQEPEGVKQLCRKCVTISDGPHYRVSGHDHRPLFQEEAAAPCDALDRVEIDGAGEKEGVLAVVGALDHGDDLVGVEAVACQNLRNLGSQGRCPTNNLKAGLVVGDPETALEDRLERV